MHIYIAVIHFVAVFDYVSDDIHMHIYTHLYTKQPLPRRPLFYSSDNAILHIYIFIYIYMHTSLANFHFLGGCFFMSIIQKYIFIYVMYKLVCQYKGIEGNPCYYFFEPANKVHSLCAYINIYIMHYTHALTYK